MGRQWVRPNLSKRAESFAMNRAGHSTTQPQFQRERIPKSQPATSGSAPPAVDDGVSQPRRHPHQGQTLTPSPTPLAATTAVWGFSGEPARLLRNQSLVCVSSRLQSVEMGRLWIRRLLPIFMAVGLTRLFESLFIHWICSLSVAGRTGLGRLGAEHRWHDRIRKYY